jgi:hypothetical protein
MSDTLSLDRFRDLADAYGGVIARWPEQYRDDAMRMATMPEAIDVLERASGLDETLDAWRIAAPGPDLHNRMLAKAPKARRDFGLRARLWWSGIGVAATLSGALAGAAAVAIVAPIDAPSDSATSFGDVSAQES